MFLIKPCAFSNPFYRRRPVSPGGDDGNRTHYLLNAIQALSQVSYAPIEMFPGNNPRKLNNEKSFSTFWVLAEIRDTSLEASHFLHRKEVIQPHLPIRLPCYDLTPIIVPTFDCCSLAVGPQASGVYNFHGLTGGVYKARERIHRDMLIRDY